MIDLTNTLIDLYTPRERTIGRYNSSDLFGIVRGWVSPEEYIFGRKVDAVGAYRMWQGKWKHEQIQELLRKIGYTCEEKVEYEFNGLTLVGKVDARKVDHILEIKTSELVMDKAKESARYQARLYVNLFQVKKGYVVQPIVKSNRLLLKYLGEVKPDDEWFQEQLKLLEIFHNRLTKIV